MDFVALAERCAPAVHHQTLAAVAQVESGFNPYAIGVVRGALVRQPRSKAEAVATAQALEAGGRNFSIGIGQVNRYNLARHGLSYADAFEPCANLRAAASILQECFERARSRFADDQAALRGAFSCYYSGNFSTGFRQDIAGQPSYVNKVLAAWSQNRPRFELRSIDQSTSSTKPEGGVQPAMPPYVLSSINNLDLRKAKQTP